MSDVHEIDDPHHKRNLLYAAERQINAHEALRIEVRRQHTHDSMDIRRWRTPPGGIAQPTARGFTLATYHIPTIMEMIKELLERASMHGDVS
jgi:hypothetical protein